MYKSWDKIYLRTMIIIYFLPHFLYQQLHYQINEYGNSTITSSDKTNWVHVYSLSVFSSSEEEFCSFFLPSPSIVLTLCLLAKHFFYKNVREFERKTNSRFKSYTVLFFIFIFCCFLLSRQSLLQLIWSHFSTLPKFLLFLLSGII